MGKILSVVAALLVLNPGVSPLDAQAPRPSAAQDDRLVLAAIIEHTTRPEVRQASVRGNIPNPGELLLVLERTSIVCESDHDPTRQACVTPHDLATLRGGSAKLVDAFVERNRQSVPMPVPDNAGLQLVPFAGIQAALKRRSHETTGYSAFSLPGYSDDGQALVFGFYTCGGRCQRGRLFVLNRTDGGWQVESVSTVWVS